MRIAKEQVGSAMRLKTEESYGCHILVFCFDCKKRSFCAHSVAGKTLEEKAVASGAAIKGVVDWWLKYITIFSRDIVQYCLKKEIGRCGGTEMLLPQLHVEKTLCHGIANGRSRWCAQQW